MWVYVLDYFIQKKKKKMLRKMLIFYIELPVHRKQEHTQ